MCPNRHLALREGLDLPRTWQQQQDEIVRVASTNPQSTLDSFLSQSTFSVELFNTVLVLWLLRHALPFSRFNDPALRAAFKLSNQSAMVRGTTWASETAKGIYQGLSVAVIDQLRVSHFVSHCSHFSYVFISLFFVCKALFTDF